MIHDPNDASLFPRLPEEEVRKLAVYGTEVRLGAGELLFSEEASPSDFFVVLEGRIEVTKRMPEGEAAVLAVHGRGEFTGDVSLITGRRATADARSVGASRVCRIAAEDFARVMVENPAVAGVVFRAVAGRTEELGAQMQQTARLTALGTMAAGLAHELNNPAAAARGAASWLGETLRRLRGLALALGGHDLSSEQRGLLASVLDAAAVGSDPAGGPDPLVRGDREDELAGWLAGRGAEDPWDLAPTFVDAGLDEEKLENAVGGLGPDAAADALGWLAATLAAEGHAREIGRAVGQVSGLVGAMKGYTYMDRAPLQDVDVREGLENTLSVLGHKMGGVAVEREYGEDLPRIWARGGELNQVWTALIDNALDAASGRVAIRAAREGDRVVVEVSDDGPGVPEEAKDRVFEPFFTTKGVGEGAGLGLDTARRAVNGHGGDIGFSSEPGDTRFRVLLPVDGSEVPRRHGP